MSPDKDAELVSRYPKIFRDRRGDPRDTAMCWGFEHGDGWFDLIDHLCRNLQWDTDRNKHPQVVATQVKEKYGSLRFYVESADERQNGMIDLIESMSMHICEVCGQRGQLRGHGWLQTLCDLCDKRNP